MMNQSSGGDAFVAFLPLVGDPSDVEDIMRDLGEGIEETARKIIDKIR